jgi:hypothetical protein
MKRLGKKPDLSDWVLPDVFDEEKTFREMLQDALEQALEVVFEEEEEKPYIYFPAEWGNHDGNGGPAIVDPLTIYLVLDSINAAYAFNLKESLAGSLEMCAEDGSFSDTLPKISHALRELANEIDAACAKHSKELQP